jgi:hypothetical protein
MQLIKREKYLYNSYNSNNLNNFDSVDNHITKKPLLTEIDLVNNFPEVYNQDNMGITSSCAITSIMSYYYKKYYNINKLFSPYYLAYNQFLSTKKWECIDLLSGLKIANNFGLCSNYLVNKHTDYNIINSNNILLDANNYKFGYFSKINFNIKNIERILTDEIPIICSIKIVPNINNLPFKFYNHFKDINYWNNVNNYYKNNDEIYSISIIIVGYNSYKKEFKIRGCWGPNVGDSGYFYIDYDIITNFSNLFFDQYIADTKPYLTSENISLEHIYNEMNVIVSENENENVSKILKIETNSNSNIKKSKSFNKILNLIDLIDLDDSSITIEISDDINYFGKKNELERKFENLVI